MRRRGDTPPTVPQPPGRDSRLASPESSREPGARSALVDSTSNARTADRQPPSRNQASYEYSEPDDLVGVAAQTPAGVGRRSRRPTIASTQSACDVRCRPCRAATGWSRSRQPGCRQPALRLRRTAAACSRTYRVRTACPARARSRRRPRRASRAGLPRTTRLRSMMRSSSPRLGAVVPTSVSRAPVRRWTSREARPRSAGDRSRCQPSRSIPGAEGLASS